MNIQPERMEENDALPPVAASSLEAEEELVGKKGEQEEEEDGEREAPAAAPTQEKKKRRSTTKKKRLSRNKSLDLSCPIMTMNKPGNMIRNKEKKWLKNKVIPVSPDNSKAMRASFTAMSLVSAGKEEEDHNDDHLISKSSPNFDYDHHAEDNHQASQLISASDPCLTMEEGGGDDDQQ